LIDQAVYLRKQNGKIFQSQAKHNVPVKEAGQEIKLSHITGTAWGQKYPKTISFATTHAAAVKRNVP
jgi:hypothetical protein